jgi:hypothetical protein
MSIAIEAPPESPGHVGHTPQPWANLGLRAGRYYDAGGIFGSVVVRSLLGLLTAPGKDERRMDAAGELAGMIPPVDPPSEYALQPFGIPGGAGAFRSAAQQPKPRTARQQALSNAHTVLAMEEAAYKVGRNPQPGMPESLARALEDLRLFQRTDPADSQP